MACRNEEFKSSICVVGDVCLTGQGIRAAFAARHESVSSEIRSAVGDSAAIISNLECLNSVSQSLRQR